MLSTSKKIVVYNLSPAVDNQQRHLLFAWRSLSGSRRTRPGEAARAASAIFYCVTSVAISDFCVFVCFFCVCAAAPGRVFMAPAPRGARGLVRGHLRLACPCA